MASQNRLTPVSEGTYTMIEAEGLTKVYRGSGVIGTRGDPKPVRDRPIHWLTSQDISASIG
jgi:hypothetical protein